MQRNKCQYHRLLKILELIKEASGVGCRYLYQRNTCRQLANCRSLAKEFEVSERTIARDIEFMRDMFGAPIEYDRARRGFSLSDDTFVLTACVAPGEEIMALVALEEAVKSAMDDSAGRVLARILDKTCVASAETIAKARTNISGRLSLQRRHQSIVRPQVFLKTVSAMARNRRVALEVDRGGDETVSVKAEPYHVFQKDGGWFVIACCYYRFGTQMEVEVIPLKDVAEVRLLGVTFVVPKDFDPAPFINGCVAPVCQVAQGVAGRNSHAA